MKGEEENDVVLGMVNLSPCQCGRSQDANWERSKVALSKSGSSPLRTGRDQLPARAVSICTNFDTGAVPRQKTLSMPPVGRRKVEF